MLPTWLLWRGFSNVLVSSPFALHYKRKGMKHGVAVGFQACCVETAGTPSLVFTVAPRCPHGIQHWSPDGEFWPHSSLPYPNPTSPQDSVHRMATQLIAPLAFLMLETGSSTSVTTCYFPPDVPATSISIVLGSRDSLEKPPWGTVRGRHSKGPQYLQVPKPVHTPLGSNTSPWGPSQYCFLLTQLSVLNSRRICLFQFVLCICLMKPEKWIAAKIFSPLWKNTWKKSLIQTFSSTSNIKPKSSS